MMRMEEEEHQSRMLYELSSLVVNLLRSPDSSISFPNQTTSPSSLARRRLGRTVETISPSGFASLLLGVSVALMMCGSLTFLLGFMLMPWVIVLIMVLYVAGVVSTISMLGRSIFCLFVPSLPPPKRDIPEWKHW